MHHGGSKYLLALFLASAASVFSTPLIVDIDTSSLSGNPGAIYFQFNPGLNADLASVVIDNFSINAPGSLTGVPQTDGGVSGSLLSEPLIIDNSGGLNDYLHFLNFGSHISFHVDFNIPSPLVGDSGSEFVFAVTGPDGLTPLLVSDPSGYYLGQIGYGLDGVIVAESLESAATITSAVPEPSYAVGIFASLLAAFVLRGRASLKSHSV